MSYGKHKVEHIINKTPALSTDSNGNTVLVGADGSNFALIDQANVLTVGASGRFSTLQSAIDYIQSKPAFNLLPSAQTANYPATCNTWTQGSSNPVTTSYLGIFIPQFDTAGTWFKLAGETRYYRVETLDQATPGIVVAQPRIEADLAAPAAISWYSENRFDIVLLDSVCSDSASITAPVCVHLRTLRGTVYTGKITISSAATSGKLVIGNGIRLAPGYVAQQWMDSTGNMALFIENGTELNNAGSDCGHGTFAEIIMHNLRMSQRSPTPLGHFMLYQCSGDIRVRGLQAEIGAISVSTPDLRIFDAIKARKFVADGVHVVVNDPNDRLTNIWVFGLWGGATQFQGDMVLQDVKITSLYQSSANVYMVDEDSQNGTAAYALGKKLSMSDCHIDATKFAGTKKLFKTTSGGSNRVVTAQACIGGVIDTPAAGSKTVANTFAT